MSAQERTRSHRVGVLAPLCLVVIIGACGRAAPPSESPQRAPTAREIALAPAAGDAPLDRRIRAQQERVRKSKVPTADFERLGLLYLARAREQSEPSGYTLALATAEAMEKIAPSSHAALMLRGMALHGLHRFSEAEKVARALVARRGLPVDLGLLGDVLADRGALDEAIATYQRMIDLRPDLHAYARAAHARYLKGDLKGAAAAMELAARAASARNRETFAWVLAKLASYRLALGERSEARALTTRALEVFPESLPALKTEAQISLSEGALASAVTSLKKATRERPHPELLWMLCDTLEALGRRAEADAMRLQLVALGEQEDPRAYALYLASKGMNLARASALVEAELRERADVYSYEALAWVQSARGEHAAALESARRSLAEGTPDVRLYYHAGMIARRANRRDEATRWLKRASEGEGMLLPSQRALLRASLAVN
jgi:tetratricopeptide (TPR) repeat protein